MDRKSNAAYGKLVEVVKVHHEVTGFIISLMSVSPFICEVPELKITRLNSYEYKLCWCNKNGTTKHAVSVNYSSSLAPAIYKRLLVDKIINDMRSNLVCIVGERSDIPWLSWDADTHRSWQTYLRDVADRYNKIYLYDSKDRTN